MKDNNERIPEKFPNKYSDTNKYFKEYCANTGIHGFRYFGEERSISERIFWVIVFVLCLSGCSFMIYTIWAKWDRSPVIVTFATKETPIYKIPFPAVTICPEVKSDRSTMNFTEIFQKKVNKEVMSTLGHRYFNYFCLLCDQCKTDQSVKAAPGDDFLEVLDKFKPYFMENLQECRFAGKRVVCDDILTPVITDQGVCYSFNILDRTHIFDDNVVHFKNYSKNRNSNVTWTIEKGYLDQNKFNVYPRRAFLSGAKNGFTISIITEALDLDYRCKDLQGYRVLLHTPSKVPRLEHEYFRVPLDTAVIARVEPSMITTSAAVKSYKLEKRDCLFPNEKKLKYFKTYSQVSCDLECLTNFTLAICGCINFYMPREKSTKICNGAKFRCMKDAERTLQTEKLKKDFKLKTSHKNLQHCNCMPLCTDLSYHVETSDTVWDWREKYDDEEKKKNEVDVLYLSSLTVYFQSNHFITSERNELYGPIDFVANFGGFLGLFIGCSILSLMEIIYYITIRIFCNVKLYGAWAGPREKVDLV